jgi:hypothetical protein
VSSALNEIYTISSDINYREYLVGWLVILTYKSDGLLAFLCTISNQKVVVH